MAVLRLTNTMWDQQTINEHLSILRDKRASIQATLAIHPNDSERWDALRILEVRIIQTCLILQVESGLFPEARPIIQPNT